MVGTCFLAAADPFCVAASRIEARPARAVPKHKRPRRPLAWSPRAQKEATPLARLGPPTPGRLNRAKRSEVTPVLRDGRPQSNRAAMGALMASLDGPIQAYPRGGRPLSGRQRTAGSDRGGAAKRRQNRLLSRMFYLTLPDASQDADRTLTPHIVRPGRARRRTFGSCAERGLRIVFRSSVPSRQSLLRSTDGHARFSLARTFWPSPRTRTASIISPRHPRPFSAKGATSCMPALRGTLCALSWCRPHAATGCCADGGVFPASS
jgi:hypothetical protein